MRRVVHKTQQVHPTTGSGHIYPVVRGFLRTFSLRKRSNFAAGEPRKAAVANPSLPAGRRQIPSLPDRTTIARSQRKAAIGLARNNQIYAPYFCTGYEWRPSTCSNLPSAVRRKSKNSTTVIGGALHRSIRGTHPPWWSRGRHGSPGSRPQDQVRMPRIWIERRLAAFCRREDGAWPPL